jgi:hypothetical protein
VTDPTPEAMQAARRVFLEQSGFLSPDDAVNRIARIIDEAFEAERAAAKGLREACRECLSAIDDAYKSTWHFKVTETSEQRIKILAAP